MLIDTPIKSAPEFHEELRSPFKVSNKSGAVTIWNRWINNGHVDAWRVYQFTQVG